MSTIPATLEREIRDLGRFKIRQTAVVDQLILTADVAGVPVIMHLDTGTYPAVPPRLELSPEWSWGRGGQEIRGLHSHDHWNRTLGIGALLRELEKRFNAEPPRQRKSPRGDGWIVRCWRSMMVWIRNLWLRFRVRGETDVQDETLMSEAIRARYQEVIVEKASRIERYKKAVAQLMAQWQLKSAKLETLSQTIQQQEQAQATNLTRAEEIVKALEAKGRTAAEIKQDSAYRRCLEAFEERSTELEQMRQRSVELETDSEEHHHKIRQHEAQLEALIGDLQQVRDEFSEVAADLTSVELEQEIIDLRVGVSRSESDLELRDLLRTFRKAKASVRITRQAAELDDETQDAEYLDVARKVTAAREFETSLGLDEAPNAVRRDRE